jgi:uncharacterized protein
MVNFKFCGISMPGSTPKQYMNSSELREQIIVFTRWPTPGRVKTRLIPALGDRGAAELHRCLAEHTINQVNIFQRQKPVGLEIQYTGCSREQVRSWLPIGRHTVQTDGDLGARFALAFANGFARGLARIIAIGTDCPRLSPAILTEAFEGLHSHELVLGPAMDGGYYLLGLSRPAPELFSNIPWGTETVLAETIKRAVTAAFSTILLEPLADVDRPEDLAHLGDHPCAR